MLTISIDPVIVTIGELSIRWYSVMIAAAIIAGTYAGLRETRRRGISDDDVYSFLTWAIIAGIIGARLFHVVDKLDYYLSNPAAILAFQQGGLAIYGAVAGGLVAIVAYARFRHLPARQILDAAAPGLILGQAIGRIGCTINGDVLGTPTDLPWGVAYTNPKSMAPELGVPAHPAAAYELIWDLIVFAVLWRMRSWKLADGTLMLLYFALYSLGRFFITFFRDDTIVLAGLSQAQIIALVVFIVAVPVALLINRLQIGEQQSQKEYGQTGV